MSDDGKKHAPRTDAHGNADTVPTANASGMPRIFPRHKDKRTSAEQDEIDEKDGDAPDELGDVTTLATKKTTTTKQGKKIKDQTTLQQDHSH